MALAIFFIQWRFDGVQGHLFSQCVMLDFISKIMNYSNVSVCWMVNASMYSLAGPIHKASLHNMSIGTWFTREPCCARQSNTRGDGVGQSLLTICAQSVVFRHPGFARMLLVQAWVFRGVSADSGNS